LTLSGVNARGFLIHRLTFKCHISFEQSSNLSTVKKHQLTSLTYSNPRGSISKSVLEYDLEFGRAPPYFNWWNQILDFLVVRMRYSLALFDKVFATLLGTLKEFSGSRVPTESRFTTAHLGDFNHLYFTSKPCSKHGVLDPFFR
jgi:hypothetical protein